MADKQQFTESKPVGKVRTVGRPIDSLPSDRKDGKDELLVQYIGPAGTVRESFSGIIGERKSGDPFAETPGAVEWTLPPLPGPPPRPGFTIRVMVMNHPVKWRATVSGSNKDGFTVKGEPEVKS